MLILAIPVALVTSSVFCILLHFAFRHWPHFRRIAVMSAFCVTAYLALEAVAVLRIGPFHIYQSLGLFYWALHMIGFVFGPPAVGILVYAGISRFDHFAAVPIILATVICWFMCILMLFVNIAIDEDINGIDDSGVRPRDGSFPP